MKLARIVSRFYSKCFVGIYATRDILNVSVLTVSGSGETEARSRAFPTAELKDEVLWYLQEAVAPTPFNYIAVVTDTDTCGAVPTCSVSKARELAPAVEHSATVCVDDEWMNYLGLDALHALQKRYGAASADAVYTPFALMHAHFEAQMRGEHALFLMLTPEAVSLCVVKEKHLRFAEHFRCTDGPAVPLMVEKIVELLEGYYGKPCCRGEFIESVFIADGAGIGEMLGKALDDILLLESELEKVEPALLAAQTCRREAGYGL